MHFGKLSAVGELCSDEVRAPSGTWSLAICLVRALHTGFLRVALTVGTAGLSAMSACTPTSLDTVHLGDNPEPPDVSLDEAFFHCQIQPLVLTASGCASGGAGESGSCHSARSALRLVDVPTPSLCQNDKLVGGAAPESLVNFERVRTSVGPDADASPLYRRPLGLDSHPRVVLLPNSVEAMLLRAWLNGQGTP